MNDASLRETVFIFTDSQSEHNECMGDYTDLALGEHGRRFYSVVLHCEQAEKERRLVADGRGGGKNGKLTDVDVLRDYRRNGNGIWKFEHDDEIEIDNTDVAPKQVAEMIKVFIDRREKEGRSSSDDYP